MEILVQHVLMDVAHVQILLIVWNVGVRTLVGMSLVELILELVLDVSFILMDASYVIIPQLVLIVNLVIT